MRADRRWHKQIHVAAVVQLVLHVHGLTLTVDNATVGQQSAGTSTAGTPTAPYVPVTTTAPSVPVSELLQTLHRISVAESTNRRTISTVYHPPRLRSRDRFVDDGEESVETSRSGSDHAHFTDSQGTYPGMYDTSRWSVLYIALSVTTVAIASKLSHRLRRKHHNLNSIKATLLCPISMELMMDPVVVVASGQTYERAAIEQWFMTHKTDPVTNTTLQSTKVVANHVVRSVIESLSARYPSHERALWPSIDTQQSARNNATAFLESVMSSVQDQTKAT